MILLYLLSMLAQPMPAPSGAATLTAYSADGAILATAEAWIISPGGGLITSRSALRGASRADVAIEGATYRVASVEGDEEDLDLIDLQLEPVATPLAALAAGAFQPPPGVRLLDVPGAGEILRLDSSAAGRATISGGKLESMSVSFEVDGKKIDYMVPAERVFRRTRTSSMTLEAWNAKSARSATLEKLYREGLVLSWLHEYERAEKILQKITSEDSAYARAWFHLGYVEAKLGHSREKIRAFRKAIDAQPDFRDAHYSLGMAYLLAGDRNAAIQSANRLKRIDPALAEKLLQMIDLIKVDPGVSPPVLPSPIA